MLFWGCKIIKIFFLPSVQAPEKGERMRATTILKGQQVAAKSKLHNVIRRHPTMPQLRRLTQEELLAEARITEEQNLASLAQFLKIEAEKKANKAIKVLFLNDFISILVPKSWGSYSEPPFICSKSVMKRQNQYVKSVQS